MAFAAEACINENYEVEQVIITDWCSQLRQYDDEGVMISVFPSHDDEGTLIKPGELMLNISETLTQYE